MVAGTNYEFVLDCPSDDEDFWETLTCEVKVYEDLLGKREIIWDDAHMCLDY